MHHLVERWKGKTLLVAATMRFLFITSSRATMDEVRVGGTSSAPDADVDVQLDHSDSRYVAGGSWLCCVPCYWLRRNNSVHKASLGIATLLVTSLLVASPVLFLISAVPASDVPRDCRIQVDESCLYAGEMGSALDGPAGTECSEPGCMAAAARLLAAMDRRADPCGDFYQFACGRWGSTVRRPGATLSLHDMQLLVDSHIQQLLANSTASGMFKKLGQFYKSCIAMKEKPVTMTPMYSLLEELGGYLPPGALGPSDLTPLLGRLLRLNGAPLVDVRLEQDPTDPTKLTVFVDVPRRGGALGSLLAFRTQYQEQAQRFEREETRGSRAYVYMKESAEEKRLLQMDKLLTDFLPSKMATAQRAREAQLILLFTTMLSKLYPREKDVVSLFQQSDSYQAYNMSRLQSLFPLCKWDALFDDVLSWNSSENDVIYVMSSGYLTSLTTMVARFQKRYSQLQVVVSRPFLFCLFYLSLTPEDLSGYRTLLFGLSKFSAHALRGLWSKAIFYFRVVHNALLLLYARDRLAELLNATSRDQPRFCSRLTTGIFSQAVSAMYVRQYPNVYIKSLEDRVKSLFMQLKTTLATRMRAALWLDADTRLAALAKLRALKGQFITWPMFSNNSYILNLMEDVQVNPENFFENVIYRYKQIRTVSIDLFSSHSQHARTWTYPFIVNAYYEPRENAIMIPLALLTQSHFRHDVPSCLTYATVGSILGHELLHGFDLHGARYDGKGRLRDWLSPEARLGLEARVDCVARQYSRVFRRQVKFMGNKVDIQFDWNITRNENMADIGALQTAHQTWKQSQITRGQQGPERLAGVSLGPRQLFFVSAAQMYCSVISPESYIMSVEMDFHAPFPERVNGIMMNSPSFSDAFNCPLGSPMNPLKKCSTW